MFLTFLIIMLVSVLLIRSLTLSISLYRSRVPRRSRRLPESGQPVSDKLQTERLHQVIFRQ